MLRAILGQLVYSTLTAKVQNLWDDYLKNRTGPSRSELLNAIEDIINTNEQVFLVLDALDEYPIDRSPGRSFLLEIITQLLGTHPHRLRLVVTSRREPDIQESLQCVASFSINVDQAFDDDVKRFVDNALDHRSIKRWGLGLVALASRKLLQSEERYTHLAEQFSHL